MRSETVSLAGARTTSDGIGAQPSRSTTLVSATQSWIESSSARASGRMPAASKLRCRGQAGQRPSQHLAPLPEAGPDELEQPGPRDVGRDHRRRPSGGSPRGPTPPSGGAGTPSGAPCPRARPSPRTRPSRSPRRRHRRPAPRPAARRPPAAPSRASARWPGHRRAGRPRAAWPRCRGGWRRAPSRHRRAASRVEAEGVAFDDPHPERLDLVPEHRHQPAVDLDGGDRGARLRQRQRERAEPGADLDDAVARTDPGEPGDAPDGVRIDDEVLAERRRRAQPVGGRGARRRDARERVTR